MRIFELSPRLQSIADLVPAGASFADIGTDHAYLPVWLILNGRVRFAIASDIRSGPLDSAKKNALRYGVSDNLSFRLSDGLAGISPDEIDTISIAGMGGETIAEILNAAPWANQKRYRLLLQPMTAQEELRRWLSCHGFYIENEVLTQEGNTLYVLFVVTSGEMPRLTSAEMWAGRQYPGMVSPLRGVYLEKLLHRAKCAAAGIQQSGKLEDKIRAQYWAELVSGLTELKREWEEWQQ